MHDFELIIAVLLGAVVLAALARRMGVPYPTLLALAGTALAFVPNGPKWTLDPQLALALFVAPVLLDAAYDTSLRDLRDNWRTVTALVVVLVGATTAMVAVVVHALVPQMPWAAAVALGAIVAPPDAAAATTVVRAVGLPHRVVKILEGESLLNDASSLLIYRIAIGTLATQKLSAELVLPSIALGLVGSLIAGYLLARVLMPLIARFRDAPSSIIVQFVGTFSVWMVAERLGLSGILTIVAFAVTLAHRVPSSMPPRLRISTNAVWETVVFLLNVLAFVMIGLQVRPIVERLSGARFSEYLMVAGAVLATCVLVRIVWVLSYNSWVRFRLAREGFHPPRPMMAPTLGSGIVVAWCGMRGIVTLAAAFALPDGSAEGVPAFPYRDLILVTAFAVVLGTLVIQGFTLKPLIRWLDLRGVDPVPREVGRARAQIYRAAIDAIEGENSPVAQALKVEYQALLDSAANDPDGIAPRDLPADPLRRRAIASARATIARLRASDEIGDDAFHQLELELDYADLNAGPAQAD